MASSTYCANPAFVSNALNTSMTSSISHSNVSPKAFVSSNLFGQTLSFKANSIVKSSPNFPTFSVKASIVEEVDVEKVIPQADRVLIRLQEVSSKTPGGVLLPSSAAKYESYLVGEVISAGKEVNSVSKGQKVLFTDLNAYEANLGKDGSKLVFVRASDLLGVVD